LNQDRLFSTFNGVERNGFMLAQYIDMALELARYEIIEEDNSYWGEIPGFQGVWAKHATLAGCQRELREALSDWLALRLRLGLETPTLGPLDLNRIAVPARA
jgi:predicted RNase H-like HicB family nuclease